MTISFRRWPDEFATKYREKGYWIDKPLTDILTCHAQCDTVALIDGERQISYRELDEDSDRLAAALRRREMCCGETALVQLSNVAEFYITYFALVKLGVVSIYALFSHQRTELEAYAQQIAPALLIPDREHALFKNDDTLGAFIKTSTSLRLVVLKGSGDANALEALTAEPVEDFSATPTAADEVAFFQLSGGSTGTPKLIPRTHNDFFVSTRRDGRSLGELVKEEMGPGAGVIALIACFMIMIIILAVLAMIVVKALAHSPWGA